MPPGRLLALGGGHIQKRGALLNDLRLFNGEGRAPGYISTDNTAALQADPARKAAILARIPAGRWGEPDDLCGAVVFLALAASNYVNGAILTVDGGWMGR
jgi:2-deoxy-D-gluconate 3-dehydrogenase